VIILKKLIVGNEEMERLYYGWNIQSRRNEPLQNHNTHSGETTLKVILCGVLHKTTQLKPIS
jgi:hypothetical protein